jgi:hypothetical protein
MLMKFRCWKKPTLLTARLLWLFLWVLTLWLINLCGKFFPVICHAICLDWIWYSVINYSFCKTHRCQLWFNTVTTIPDWKNSCHGRPGCKSTLSTGLQFATTSRKLIISYSIQQRKEIIWDLIETQLRNFDDQWNDSGTTC